MKARVRMKRLLALFLEAASCRDRTRTRDKWLYHFWGRILVWPRAVSAPCEWRFRAERTCAKWPFRGCAAKAMEHTAAKRPEEMLPDPLRYSEEDNALNLRRGERARPDVQSCLGKTSVCFALCLWILASRVVAHALNCVDMDAFACVRGTFK